MGQGRIDVETGERSIVETDAGRIVLLVDGPSAKIQVWQMRARLPTVSAFTALLTLAVAEARRLGATELWGRVPDTNPRLQAFCARFTEQLVGAGSRQFRNTLDDVLARVGGIP